MSFAGKAMADYVVFFTSGNACLRLAATGGLGDKGSLPGAAGRGRARVVRESGFGF